MAAAGCRVSPGGEVSSRSAQTSPFRAPPRRSGTAASKHNCLQSVRSLQAQKGGRYRSSGEAALCCRRDPRVAILPRGGSDLVASAFGRQQQPGRPASRRSRTPVVRRHEVGNQDRSAALRLPRRGALRYVRRFGSAASGCRNRTNLAVGLHRRTALPSTTSASGRRRSSRFISPELRASSIPQCSSAPTKTRAFVRMQSSTFRNATASRTLALPARALVSPTQTCGVSRLLITGKRAVNVAFAG